MNLQCRMEPVSVQLILCTAFIVKKYKKLLAPWCENLPIDSKVCKNLWNFAKISPALPRSHNTKIMQNCANTCWSNFAKICSNVQSCASIFKLLQNNAKSCWPHDPKTYQNIQKCATICKILPRFPALPRWCSHWTFTLHGSSPQ